LRNSCLTKMVQYDTVKPGLPQLRAGLAFSCLTFVFLFVAFVTSFWFQSWPRIHSTFLRIGLWEACFSGFIHPADPDAKAYFGCWWILSTEYNPIRFWLFPGWFIAVEVFATLALITSLFCLAYHTWAYLQFDRPSDHVAEDIARTKKRVRSGFILAALTGSFQTSTVLIFGVASRVDWNWMPMQFFNYLSWSYGLAVVAAAFAFFTMAADYIFQMKLRNLRPTKNYEVSSSVSSYLVRKI